AGKSAVLGQFGEGLATHQQAVAHGPAKALAQCGGMFFDLLAGADDEFGRCRRSRCAQVGDEISDGEIGFVADCGDYGDLRRSNGACESFVIEGGQVFGGTAAASDDNYVDVIVLVEKADAG